MPPTMLVNDWRGQQAFTGPIRIATLDGGLFFSQVGPDIPAAGNDETRVALRDPYSHAVRFRGQIYAVGGNTDIGGRVCVFVYDEGGTNTWTFGVTAKGGRGIRPSTAESGQRAGQLSIVNTEAQDYLCLWYNTDGTVPRCLRYNPDSGLNGTWTEHVSAGGVSEVPETFVFNGVYYATFKNGTSANNNHSFDPASGAAVVMTNPYAVDRDNSVLFSLHDRLFSQGMRVTAGAFNAVINELALGAWGAALPTATIPVGHNVGGGASVTAIPISPTKVMVFGCAGGGGGTGGLGAFLVETVGDAPAGALQVTDVTDPVIPSALRPTSVVGNPYDYRVTAMVDTVSVPGIATFWLVFHPDGVATVTGATLFQVTDELTELVDFGPMQSDSDFAYPKAYYGGGAYMNGIDGSTRLVSVSPRGYAAGTTGLNVHCSAHGDPVVLQHEGNTRWLHHGAVAGGPFQTGEIVTGTNSGATGEVVDPQALTAYVRVLTGAFSGGELITGGTSGATATLNLRHLAVAGGPFQVAETITGGTSGATAVVVTVNAPGLDPLGSLEVNTVVGVFVNGEVLTGGTSGATATNQAFQSPGSIVGESITGGSSGASGILVGSGAAEGFYMRGVSGGPFTAGEVLIGGTSGFRLKNGTTLNHGAVALGPFQVGETVTGGTSGATANVTHLGIGGLGETLVKIDTEVGGPFQNGEVITGGTSGASATLSAAPAGQHGGTAVKKIRARFFLGTGPVGKGVPISGACSMVLGSGVGGVVSIGSGPGGEDELINVVADGAVGGDTELSFEWDFLADGVPKFLATNVVLEIDRV